MTETAHKRNLCNKCNTVVPRDNDAVLFDLLMTNNPLLVFAISRHLLPVVVNGERICEGSPSRAQYLEGQPRDVRGSSYNSDNEELFRTTYARLLQENETAGAVK